MNLNFQTDGDTEMEDRESNRNFFYNKINKLYDEVILKFKNAEFLAYDPYIFRNLTREKFTKWIVYNNPDVAKIII